MAIRTIFFTCAFLTALGLTSQAGAKPSVFGYLENALVYPGAFPVEAKLDTGADHSSVHARIVRRWKKGGLDWVAFQIENKAGGSLRLEAPVERTARVRQHSGDAERRVVVLLELCVGTVRRMVQVNLVDREVFRYKLLIGRSFLANHIIVDSAARFTAEPACR